MSVEGHKLALPVKLYFLAVALPVYFHVGPLLMTGVRALLLVMVIPLCINLLSGKYGRILPTDILYFLFSIWIVITLYINSPESALSFGGSVAVEFFGGYLLARAYIRSAQDMAAMCKILFYVVLFTIPLALYEGQTGRAFVPELIRKLPGLDSVEDFYNELAGRRLGLERTQVIFAHPIHYGLFCATAFSLTVVALQNFLTSSQRFLAGGFVCFAAFLSLSSGAILPLMLQIGFIIWAVIFRSIKSKWIVLLALIFLIYIIIDLLSNRTPIDVFMTYATFSPGNAYWRKSIFEWGMKNVWANPFVGLGLNDWFRPYWMYIDSVDNFWLLSAMRYGITGFAMLAIGFFLPIWNIAWKKIDTTNPASPFRRAWVCTFIGLSLALCTVDIWATMFAHVAFLFGSGMWFLTSNLEIKDKSDDVPVDKIRTGGVVYTRFPQSKPADSPV